MGIFDRFKNRTPASEPDPPPAVEPAPVVEAAPPVPQIGVLPAWAKVSDTVPPAGVSAVIEVDTGVAYDYWLKLLGVSEIDQYWLEVVYQCTKMDVQTGIEGTALDPRVSGKPVQFHFLRDDRYAQAKHKVGRGPSPATKGREARGHYQKVRGRLPF